MSELGERERKDEEIVEEESESESKERVSWGRE